MQTMTIERTNKKWKLMQLWSLGLLLIGPMVLVLGAKSMADGAVFGGALMFVVGGILRYVAKVGAWWTNG